MASSTLPKSLGLGALVSVLTAAAPASAHAQIVTDRPDFVESSATVGAGAFQLETSVSYGRTGAGAVRSATWSTPTLLRLGVGDALELRLESAGWIRDASAPGQGSGSGLADAAVGAKWRLKAQRGASPAAALLVHAELPSGATDLQGDGVRPSLRAVAEWELPEGFALGVMPGIAVGRASGEGFPSGILGLVVGKAVTSSLRTFAEVSFPQLAAAQHGGHVGTFNTGLALLLTDHVQLDTGLSWGLTESAEDLTWGFGLSVFRPGA
jgi:hypothetical protein